MKFTLNNENKTECEIIKTFSKDDINYIVYTDGTKDDAGNLLLYSSRYVMENNNIVLKDIIDDSEWDYIDSKIQELG